MQLLLDTTVLSELVRPAPNPRVVAWIRGQSPLDLAISVLTLGELAKGIRGMASGRRRGVLDRWLATELPQQFRGRTLPVDALVAIRWGELAAEARRAGRPLPVLDGLLLATAGVHGLALVTRNTTDCAGRGVAVVDPWG